MLKMKIFALSSFLIVMISSSVFSFQLEDSVFTISDKSIFSGQTIQLENWKMAIGDNPEWKTEFFNYNSLPSLNSDLQPKTLPDSLWTGIAWFQTKIAPDSSLIGTSLGIYFFQAGASEIYVNGIKVYSLGTIFPSATKEIPYRDNYPRPINLEAGKENLISIRYSNHELAYFHNQNFMGGFELRIGNYFSMVDSTFKRIRSISVKEIIFMVVPGVLSILHLFLFLFDSRHKQNLFYSIFLWMFILFIYSNYESWFVTEASTLILFNYVGFAALILTTFFATTTIKSIIGKYGKYYFVFFLLAIAVIVYSIFGIGQYSAIAAYVYITLISFVAGLTIFSPQKISGVFIIRFGVIIMSVLGIYQLLQNYEIAPPLFNQQGIYVYGVLGFIISMSVYLAYEYIRTGKELEFKIGEVENLSKDKYKQELETKKREVENKILEADNNRKTKELEDARDLQLSMLPRRIPSTEYFDISVKMKTAMEVGGDYYDAAIDRTGVLAIALGDATGHGNKAGIMVAITKSMFTSIGTSLMIPDFFKKCTAVIKKMRLGNLFMSLILLRIKGYNVTFSSAGMPPILYYKKQKNQVKELIIKSMPLGASVDFPYENFELETNPGDILLVCSDGILELFDKEKEMFGKERLINIFNKSINESPAKIVEAILKEGENWLGSESQNDDITIMAIKFK